MKKNIIVFLIILSACSQPKLIVRNGTDCNIRMYLTAYTKRFSSNYTILPGREMVVGEYKNNSFEFVTTPYMFIREKSIVRDSILDQGNKVLSKLSVNIKDSLRMDKHIVDSLFYQAYLETNKKRPKKIVWTLSDTLFNKETVKNIQGLRLSTGQYISQEPISRK